MNNSGKISGTITERPSSWKVELSKGSGENRKRITKGFNFKTHGGKEKALSAAKQWRSKTSDANGLTRNKIKFKGKYLVVDLSKGYKMLCDKRDLELVQNNPVYVSMGETNPYAVVLINKQPIKFHRYIMGEPEGKEVDHINRKSLDNRRENLRIVSRRDNANNRGMNKNNKSGVNGIWSDSTHWVFEIVFEGKKKRRKFLKSKYTLREVEKVKHSLEHKTGGYYNNGRTNKKIETSSLYYDRATGNIK